MAPWENKASVAKEISCQTINPVFFNTTQLIFIG